MNPQTTTHTATPWKVSVPPSSCLTCRFIEAESGEHIAKIGHLDFTSGSQASDLANAELIVRTVNSHAQMVEALEYSAGILSDMPAAPDCIEDLQDSSPEAANYLRTLRGLVLTVNDKARRALSLAKGEA